MKNYKFYSLNALIISGASIFSANAFMSTPSFVGSSQLFSTFAENEVDDRTGKRTGNSFLSDEVKERAAKGNPIEKVKQEKDGTSAFVDVYEYARKIREGEMTWEDVDKADLDTVSKNTKFISFII
jgi:uncharacterized protein YjbJ (UPF0337 family)